MNLFSPEDWRIITPVEPLLIDAGVGTYTRETFSKERYTIWAMQSNYHNVPLINGVAQHQGRTFTARNSTFTTTKTGVRFSFDISGAYPKDAAVSHWKRAYQLERNRKFIISDTYRLTAKTGATRLHFPTTLPGKSSKPGELILKSKGVDLLMLYDPKLLSATVEKKDIDDPKLKRAIGNVVYRIVLEIKTENLIGNTSVEILEGNK